MCFLSRTLIAVFFPLVQLTVVEIKAEMEKTLHWLVPVATSTAKYESRSSNKQLKFHLLLAVLGANVFLSLLSFTMYLSETELTMVLVGLESGLIQGKFLMPCFYIYPGFINAVKCLS